MFQLHLLRGTAVAQAEICTLRGHLLKYTVAPINRFLFFVKLYIHSDCFHRKLQRGGMTVFVSIIYPKEDGYLNELNTVLSYAQE